MNKNLKAALLTLLILAVFAGLIFLLVKYTFVVGLIFVVLVVIVIFQSVKSEL